MTVTVTCIECGQPFTMDVDPEGWRVPAIQELAKTARCNKCFDAMDWRRLFKNDKIRNPRDGMGGPRNNENQKNQSPRDPF